MNITVYMGNEFRKSFRNDFLKKNQIFWNKREKQVLGIHSPALSVIPKGNFFPNLAPKNKLIFVVSGTQIRTSVVL